MQTHKLLLECNRFGEIRAGSGKKILRTNVLKELMSLKLILLNMK